jgi:hypothetical protein
MAAAWSAATDEERHCGSRMRRRPGSTDLVDDCRAPTVPDHFRESQ